MGSPAPRAEAVGSSTSSASRAPADWAASTTARRSTLVAPTGTPTITRVSGTGTTL